MGKVRLTLEPTEEFYTTEDGMMLRAWTGVNDRNEGVVAFIAVVATREHADHAPDGLLSIPPPTAAAARRWAAEVLSRRYGER
jgi:hypothetical protein